MLRLRHAGGIGFGIVCASAAGLVPAWGRPTVTRDTPTTCQTINQQDINNIGRTTVAETLEKLPGSPFDCPKPNPSPQAHLSPFDQRILDAQNLERINVGVPPLRWNDELAQHATDYAQILARTGQLVHAPREGRGTERENLQRGIIGWSPERMIQDWTKEKSLFHPGLFPDICSGDWTQCAHYTQLIWPTTTDVGCGMAQGLGFNWFVCRYSPGGNKDGKPVGMPVNIANVDAPALPPPPAPQGVREAAAQPPQIPPTQERPTPPPTVQPAAAPNGPTTVENFKTQRRVAFCGHMWIIVNTYDNQGKKTGELSLHFSPAGYEINPTSQDIYPKGFAIAVDSTRDADQRLIDMWKYQIAHQSELVSLPVMGPWSPGNNCWTQSLWWAWYGIEPNEKVSEPKNDWPSDCKVTPTPDWAEKSRRLHKAWDRAETVAQHLDVVGQYMSEAFRSAKDFCLGSGGD